MITINEDAARRNKENMSFDRYTPGSATAEYQEYCRDADEKAAQYPDNPKAQEAAERFKIEIGAWLNKHNARGAGHVSVMISGPANYNMKKHEKWLSAEDKGWKDYEAIKQRFESAMHGPARHVIHISDADALEELQAELAKEQERHDQYIEENKQARKEGKESANPTYMVVNLNSNMKRIKDQIAQVEKMRSRGPREQHFDGIHIKENTEAGRVQIFFDGRPDAAMRVKLKHSGWHWSPRAGAWQRQLTDNAWRSATEILEATP